MLILWMSSTLAVANGPAEGTIFRAGVAAVDISPVKLPVISSGGFLARSGSVIHDRLFARGLALDDGTTRIVLVVVDTLFVSRDLCDRVKQMASKTTGVPASNLLIAANHIHSSGSLVGCLGTEADPDYVAQVGPQLVECIERAVADLEPAQIGWSSEIDEQDTHCRVFIRRPDRIGLDPFGEKTIRVMMHPGYQNPQYIGPSGPVDNELSVLAVRSLDGKPIGVLANYSMHYFGSAPISADYFGDFVRVLSKKIAPDDDSFVAMMSNGTSGDLHWMDYTQPRRNIGRTEYAEAVAAAAKRAYDKIDYRDTVKLGVVQRCIRLSRRVPDEARWAWAQGVLETMESPIPANQQQVYAREAKYLKEEPTRELTLQVIRVGELGIAALPNETYSITGLKLKLRSPMANMFTIELANGCEGYIPPPEALSLGGYNAWPARTAGLQVDAETIITDTLLSMFEQLSGKQRKREDLSQALYAKRVLDRKPLAYWRLGEMDGTRAEDISGAGNHGQLESGYLFYLDGPKRDDLRCGVAKPRAIQFVGGRMKATVDQLGDDYAVELFFWNGLPNDNRPVTGYLFSRGPEGVDHCPGDHLGICGNGKGAKERGRLMFFNGDEKEEMLTGGPVIEPKTWNHVRLVRRGDRVRVFLNFEPRPIISGRVTVTRPQGCSDLFIGGRSDKFANFEGRIADVAVFPGEPR
ncbi:MAG: LamG-like jellyroll fold domain-containing protein [Pirellulales bacterium]